MSKKKYGLLSAAGAALTFLMGCAVGVLNAQVSDGGPAVRITLQENGAFVGAQGRRMGNWEPERRSQNYKPASLGAHVANIQVYEHNGTDDELVDEEGASDHSHSGGATPPWSTHCHRWIYVGGNYYLVHCG